LQVDSLYGVPGSYDLTLRGISTGYQASNTVATYIDDVPVGTSGTFALGGAVGLDLFPYDLDHVEVLEGPQGTLYGASSMGGLLKYVTRTPSLTEDSYQVGGDLLGVQHSSQTGWSGRAAANFVVVPDQLAISLSGAHQYYPGYIDNVATHRKDFNDGTQDGARAVVYWRPNDELSVKVQGLYDRSDFNGLGAETVDSHGAPVYGNYTVSAASPEGLKNTTKLVSANMDYDFSFAKLTSITSYSDRTSYDGVDATATFEPIFGVDAAFVDNVHIEKFTEEVRLASPDSDRFHWMVGTFFTNENTYWQEVGLAYAPGTTTLVPALSPLLDGVIPSRFREWALFTNETFKLTDAWDISAGLRYSRNTQTVSEVASGVLEGGVVDLGTVHSDDDSVTYSTSTSYHFSRDEMLYARIASGYRPGGPNFISTGVPSPTYGPDKLTNYEVGWKSDLLDRRLLLNLTAFFIEWSKIQLEGGTPAGLAYLANGGSATSKGLELNTSFQVTRELTLGGAVSYTDARLKDDAPQVSGVAGDPLPLTARWASSITGDYKVLLNEQLQAHVGAVWRYTGPRNEQFPDAAFYERLGSYSTANATAGIINSRVSVDLFVRNLTDHRAYTSWQATTGPVVLQPRTVGVSFDFKL
jgi:iron complex outermembrane recepter protein